MTTAFDYFGGMVREYDSLIHRAVPVYEEMLERLERYSPPEASRVLELGCGAGNTSVRLAAHYPDASLTLVDGSREMLDATTQRLGDRPGVVTVASRFEELAFEPGSFDLVTSSVALHHVADKAGLFARIHDWLAPGGSFVFADQMRGQTDAQHAINWNTMVDFWHRPGNLNGEEVASLEQHAVEHDHYAPIIEQVLQIQGAGFVDVDVVWRSWMWGIVAARRAPV